MFTPAPSKGGMRAKRWLLGLAALLWLVGAQWAGAQTAADGFNPNVNDVVYASTVQPDGRMVVGGVFTQVSGSACVRLARMNPDGTLDSAFNANASADSAVMALAVQSADGKLMVGGSFASLDGAARSYLGRLNSDGTLDTSFTTGANGPVYAIAVQTDGKIVVGGNFTTVGGVSCQGIARLNSDGSIDGTFSGSVTGIVYKLWVPSTSSTDSRILRILVGGSFSALGGQAQSNIGRLNSDGSPDITFTPSANGPVYSFDRQADGKILVGGSFSSLCGGAKNSFGRLNANGTLDTTYGASFPGVVYSVAVEPDGRTVAGGSFTLGSCKNLARFQTSGALDTSLALSMAGAGVRTLTAEPDGKVLFGGAFTSVGGLARNNLARVYSDGTLDVDFNPGANFGVVYSFEVQGDGKILVAGQFTTLASHVHYRIGRLNQNGTSDETFQPAANAEVDCIALLSTGTMLVGGNFTQLNSTSRNYIGRLAPDGTLDTSYNPGANGQVLAFAVQADNKVLVGGAFTNLASTGCNYLARLNADGTLDTTFTASANSTVKTFAVQTDGKIIVGGFFTTMNGVGRNGIARLNADGTLDTTFNPAAPTSITIDSVAVQSDGKVLVAGQFAVLGGTNYNCIGRLNADGTLDTTFSNSAGADGEVRSIVAQANGQILLGGMFANLGSQKRSHVGRLNSDGTLDTSFVADCCAVSNTDGYVVALALQPDGKILVGGNIGTVTGLTRIYLGRITSAEPVSQNLLLGWTGTSSYSTVTWTSSGATPAVNSVYMDYSLDSGTTFLPVGTGSAARVGTTWQTGGFSAPMGQTILLRARATTNGGDFNGSSGVVQTVAQVEIPTTQLNNLALSSGTLTPVFATSTTNYTITTAFGTGTMADVPLTITPTSQDPNATILIAVNSGGSMVVNSGAASGVLPLVMGSNQIAVNVSSWNGIVPPSNYLITVNRLASTDATLSNLALSAGVLSPTFSSGVLAYTATVANAVTSVVVTPTLSDSTASITSITGTSGFIVGTNTITVNTLAQDGSTTKAYTVAVTRLPSSNAALSNLTLSIGVLSPSFSSSGTSYTVTVSNNVTSEVVTPTLADPTATVTGVTGNNGFVVGSNTIMVSTLAQDGSTARTYVVVVTRQPSSNAHLASLVVSPGGYSPTFSQTTLAYSSTVGNSTTSVTVTTTLADSTATVTSITGTSGFVVGSNTVTINTRAQDGSTLAYTVTVTRLPSSNAHLSNLVVTPGGYSPAFAQTTLAYSSTVGNGVTSVTVTTTLADSTATVTSITGTSGFVVGQNTVTVNTQAQDGSTLAYTVTVTRLPSNNAFLSNIALSTGTYSPTFSQNTYGYSGTVSNAVASVTVTPTLTDTTATIASITGTNLVVGYNPIVISTLAQDGSTTKTYTVTLRRLPSSNADLSNVTLSAGTLAPAFSSSVLAYSATVANLVTSEIVTPTLADPTGSVTSITGTSGFITGTNTIAIHTLAQDGSTSKTYTISVRRLPSTNVNLASLAVSTGTYSPAFLQSTLAYSTTVANAVTAVTVTAAPADGTATLSFGGTSGFVVGPNPVTVTVTAEDTITSQTYTVTITRLPSANADLSGLALSAGALSPSFSSGVLAYSTTVANAVTSETVTATLSDTTATVTSITGTSGLVVGANTITVNTRAQDGVTTKAYTVTVTRLQSSNADLAGLSLSAGTLSPSFSSGVLNYTATVANAVTGETVTATLADATATITSITGTSGLVVGANTITVNTRAQDGVTTKAYTVTVTRLPSSNADLSALSLSAGTLSPSFSSGVLAYSATVANLVTSETVSATLADATASITSITGTSGFVVGANTITVNTLAQDGSTTRTYTVTVTRRPSANADLSGLSLSAGTLSPSFSSAVIAYSATVANTVTSETVTATLSDTTATITSITGTSGFVVGANTITVNTQAQDGSTTKTYTVTVSRLPSANADLASLSLSIGTFAPSFSSGVIAYSATVANTVTSETVTATVSDPTASITSITGTSGFAVGGNTITVNTLAQDGSTSKSYSIAVTRLPSSNADLAGLSLSAGVLSPSFASGVLAYSTTVANVVTSETVTATLADATATITSITGTSGLLVGANTITVNTQAQDGSTTKAYTVTVTRLPSSNADLASLSLSAGALSPSFSAGVLTYSATVANAVTSEVVTATLADPTASITSITGTAGFVVGANTITINTQAQDGSTTETYTVTVTRLPSSNADLASLSLSAGTLNPSFSSATIAYSATVANAVTSETVTATLSDTTATITSLTGTAGFVVGANTITINTQAQDGVTTKTYTVTVTRLPSSNADLASLSLSTGAFSPTFASGVLAYSATVANAVTSETVTATLADATATITSITGTSGLLVGANTITVNTQAQDGSTTKAYTVTVTRLPSSNADLSGLTLSDGTLSPVFASGVLAYSTTVANAVTSETVTATLADATATITSITGTSGLLVGANTITVNTLAQDGSTSKAYTIAVTRLPSSNADLSGLTLSDGTLSPVFASGVLVYSTTVANAVTSETVTATLSDTTGTITSLTGTAGFFVGANTITVSTQAQDGVTTKTYTVTVTRLPSSNADLASLTLSAGTLRPSFASGVLTYSATVANAVTSETVTATLSDTTGTITSITGTAGFVVGANTITVSTQAQDGVTTKTYTVTVTRLPSSNADLASLSLSTGTFSPAFASGVTVYSATVANAVTGETVTAALSDTTASITSITGTSGFVVGGNTITVNTLAQDGSTSRAYTIAVTRQASSNADLSGLTLSSGTLAPVFSGSGTSYTVTVDNSVTGETVTATLSDTTASVTSITGTSGLVVGTNTITVNTLAQDGVTTKTYTVTVTRLPSSNADLASLAVSSGTLTPVFSTSGTSYTVAVPNSVTSETVSATAADSTATVTGTGATALSVGPNTINVTATAQDGTTSKVYTVVVTRSAGSDANLASLTLSSGTLSPVFSASGTSYTATVTNDVTSEVLTATTDDPTATVTSITGASNFVSGTTNTILVTVTAPNNVTTKVYKIVVMRMTSSDANLSSLTMTTGTGTPVTLTPSFTSSGTSYNAVIATTNTSVRVAGVPEEAHATVAYSGTSGLVLGLNANTVKITVTAQDGVTKTVYRVLVTRANSNAKLTALKISSGTLAPVFSGTVYSYSTASVHAALSSVTVTPTLSDTNATVQACINGGAYSLVRSGTASSALPLQTGSNRVDVLVTAQDGVTTLTYSIGLTRTLPAVTTGTATRLRQDGATMNGIANADGLTVNLFYRYGLTTAYTGGTVSAVNLIDSTNVASGTQAVPFTSDQLVGLSGSTTYHFQLFAICSGTFGEIDGADQTFTTLATGLLITHEGVAMTGSAAPVGTNAKWTLLRDPVINSLSHTAFVGMFSGTGIGAGKSWRNDTGLFAEIGNHPLSLILRTGQTAPGTLQGATGTNTATFFTFVTDPAFNRNDSIAFIAGVAGGDAWGGVVSGSAFNNVNGIWSIRSGTGAPAMVARTESPAPLESSTDMNAVFAAFHWLVLPDNDSVVFSARIKGPIISATGNSEGIWAQDNAGQVRLVIRTGDTNLLPGKTVTALSLFPLSNMAAFSGIAGQTRSFDPVTGDIVFNATFNDGSTGVFSFKIDYNTWSIQNREVLISGSGASTVPGIAGAYYVNGGIRSQALNSGSQVAVTATLKGVGVSASNNMAIFLDGSGGSGLQRMLRTGDHVPAIPPFLYTYNGTDSLVHTGTNYSIYYTVSDPILNNHGEIAFLAKLTNAVTTKPGEVQINGKAYLDNSYGIYSTVGNAVYTSGSLHVVARQEDVAPETNRMILGTGTAAGRLVSGSNDIVFQSFLNLVLPDVGSGVFVAQLKEKASGRNAGQAIYVVDHSGNIKLFLRTGSTDYETGRIVVSFRIFKTAMTGAPWACDAQDRSFNPENADIVLSVTFKDGHTGVFRNNTNL